MDPTDTRDGLTDELAGLRPSQSDPFASALRAQVRRSLVGAREPFRLGRFTVLEPLGSGGMGVVFVAYDPDLDRKIALKVLRDRGERGRREVLREGRALARLKHANVVAVYEVGVVEEAVFVAMEFVEGENLRAWLRGPRTAAEILARLIEAGRGLAAAHAVELVHHDFKPDNVVIDATGHARVIDFGMARVVAEEGTTTARTGVGEALATTLSAHGGTPQYMAPERLAGGAGDRLSDQYAYCVTCWEALFGARPDGERPTAPGGRGVPGWVRRVIERGLARAPGQRWPSMAALLAALGRGERGVRVRRAIAAVVVVAAIAAGAEGWRRREVAAREAACAATGAEIAGVWNEEARQRLRAAFTATGASHAAEVADRVSARLDEQADAWARARTEVCSNSEVRGRWDAEVHARAVYCLDERRMDLAALVATFVRADASAVRAAPRAVGLGSTDPCLDEGLLLRQPRPPELGRTEILATRDELARARSLGLAGDFAGGLAVASRAREVAEQAFEWPPLWAAARALEGAYLDEVGAYDRAETASQDAYFAAARAGAWGVAADAATRLIFITGYRLERHEVGRMWARHAALAIAYAGDWGGLAEARRLSSLGNVAENAGDYAEAQALHERALALWEGTLGADHPEVAIALSNLGNVHYDTGAYAEALRLSARVLAIRERIFGPDHPEVGSAAINLGRVHAVTGAYAEARPLFERSLAIAERALGPDHPEVAKDLNNLANLDMVTGAYAEARGLFERSLAIRERALGPEHPEVATSLNNLGALHGVVGAYAEALPLFERALKIREKALGPDHLDVAACLVNVSTLKFEAGAYAEARALGERALAIQVQQLGAAHPEVAATSTHLAGVHARTGAVAEAQRLLERALAIQEASLGPGHPDVAGTLMQLGHLHLGAHRAGEALPLLERAVAGYDAHPGDQPGEPDARFALAQALVATRGDRARAQALAGAAREGFRAEGAGKQTELAAVETWLARQAR